MIMKVNHSFFLPRSANVELFDETSYRNSVSKILLNTNKILQKKLDESRGAIKVQDEIYRRCMFLLSR